MTSPSPRPVRVPPPINTRTETVLVTCGLVLSVLSWLINPWFLLSLVGLALSIRALIRVRRIEGRPHRVIFLVGVIGVVVGVVGLIGSILSIAIRTA